MHDTGTDGDKLEKRRRQNRESQRRFRDRIRNRPQKDIQGTALPGPQQTIAPDGIFMTPFEFMPMSPNASSGLGPVPRTDLTSTMDTSGFSMLWDSDAVRSSGSPTIDSIPQPPDKQPIWFDIPGGPLTMPKQGLCISPAKNDTTGTGAGLSSDAASPSLHTSRPFMSDPGSGQFSMNNCSPLVQTGQLYEPNLPKELGRAPQPQPQSQSASKAAQPRGVQYAQPRTFSGPRKPSKSATANSQVYTPFGHLKRRKPKGRPRNCMKGKMDMMIAEIQEIYRVGVVIGIFCEDPKLQQHLEAVRKRFRVLTKRKPRKENEIVSSSDDSHDDANTGGYSSDDDSDWIYEE